MLRSVAVIASAEASAGHSRMLATTNPAAADRPGSHTSSWSTGARACPLAVRCSVEMASEIAAANALEGARTAMAGQAAELLRELGLEKQDYLVGKLLRRWPDAVGEVVDRLGSRRGPAVQDGVGVVEDAVAGAAVVVVGQVEPPGVEDVDGLLQSSLVDTRG